MTQQNNNNPLSTERLSLLTKLYKSNSLPLALSSKTIEPFEIELLHRHLFPEKFMTKTELALSKIITVDERMIKLKSQAAKFAPREENILIYGETGTGKELIANVLHGNRSGPVVAVNCAAVSETLFESELFGHVKGSFTGANTDRIGYIQHAETGTLFLDEIGDMPLQLQAKLLRVLENRTYRRIGNNEEWPVRCRFIFATHQNLKQRVKERTFRQDLYWRIAIFVLETIPLSERREDILLYLDKSEIKDEEVRTQIVSRIVSNLDREGGNYRQLESLVKRFKVLGEI